MEQDAPPSRMKLIPYVTLCTGLTMTAVAIYSVTTYELYPTYLALNIAGFGLFASYAIQLQRRKSSNSPHPPSNLKRYALGLALVSAALLFVLTRAIPVAALSAFAIFISHQLIRFFAKEPPAKEEAKPDTPRARHGLDNIAGLASAGMLVVLAYNFGIEAFRIPTGSMEPTLHGDVVWGDRALVNKLSYRLSDPEREDICVFRFPMNRSQPFVKRCVGLPGETVLIAQGDVYIQESDQAYPHIWRKDNNVRETMWIPYYAYDGGGEITLSSHFERISGKASVNNTTINLKSDDTKAGVLRFPHKGSINDHNPTDHKEFDAQYEHESVADIRVRCGLQGEGTFALKIVRGQSSVTLRIVNNEATLEIQHQGGDLETLEVGEITTNEQSELVFAVADDRAEITLNATPLKQIEFEGEVQAFLRTQHEKSVPIDLATSSGMRRLISALPSRDDCHLRLVVEKGSFNISDLAIDRDIHYLGAPNFDEHKGKLLISEQSLPYSHTISDNGFFVLGDNSENSLDSRQWYTLTLTTREGEVYKTQLENLTSRFRDHEELRNRLVRALSAESDTSLSEALGSLLTDIQSGSTGRSLAFVDIFGIERTLAVSSIEQLDLKHTPEVPRQLMDGQLVGSLFPSPRFVN